MDLFYSLIIPENYQHQQMAAHYRQTIGRILQEFDTGIAVPNNQLPAQFYNDLAWEGLGNTVIWNNLSTTEKNRIISAVNNFENTGQKNCN